MAESHDQETIYKEFEKRSRQRMWLRLVMVAGIPLLFWRSQPVAFGLGGLLALVAGLGSTIAYSCPVCNETLGKGEALYCPRCGVRLRRP